MKNQNVKRMAAAAMVAALYFALSLPFLTLYFGAVQLRVSEALTLLAIFSTEPILGLTLGCVLVNAFGAFTGMNILGPLDVVIGSGATLLAAYLTYQLQGIRFRGLPVLAALPPVLVNGVIVGLELTLVINNGFSLPIFLINFVQVALGELVACFCLGLPLVYTLEKNKLAGRLFPRRTA